MFYCDPFGHTRPENLYNYGSDTITETDYIFFHDQEPVQLEAHRDLFKTVVERNLDIKRSQRKIEAAKAKLKKLQGRVIVSEQGEQVQQLCDIYGWQSSYFFFHGWACLDWFRGYDRTFLFDHPEHRPVPRTTFMSPNRIIGGERDHRSLFIYHCARLGLMHNHVSAPAVCPVENISIMDVAMRYNNRYSDIEQVLQSADLPRLFQGEETQQMTSCWLGNYAEAMDSMVYVPTETVFFGSRTHLTEKTFKAIALGMPFVLAATAGSLEYLRSYGFRTFDHIWDESYDQETDDLARLEKVVQLLKNLDELSAHQREVMWSHALPVITHNWNHFYHGGFESVLWKELIGMLSEL